MIRARNAFILLNVWLLGPAAPEAAEDPPVPAFNARRATGPIRIDGQLDDPGWQGAEKVETWYEVNPGDNTPPKVKNVGYLAFDEHSLYVGLEFHDPDPSRIIAPFGDHDSAGGPQDYGGVIIDPDNDGRTGILFLANPRGIQYDAVADDAAGNEDSSPDFFWRSAGRITPEGWLLEIAIPFSSLRYPKRDPQTWGIMLYRNHPREFRYQYFSTWLPRGGNCFICRSNKLTGLAQLPSGGHLVVAPYVSASQAAKPPDGPGSGLKNERVRGDLGLDVKWTPGATTALDATINPDFSQIESDVAQIGSNERFALFFPEKRPFFLEGVDLFSTPIQAVYTRTITSPRWGARVTGKLGRTAYTALVAEDAGGGSVILPGPNSSDLADQDFRSWAGIARMRRDFGRSFVSLLGTAREVRGGAHNRVFGPDFQWRPSASELVTGQLLFSHSRTPQRPAAAAEWDGRSLSGRAANLWWLHTTRRLDWIVEGKDFGDEFRADNGFVPQVGYRRGFFDGGYTFYPTGFLRRLRLFASADYSADGKGDLLNRELSFGTGMNGLVSSFLRLRYAIGRVRAGEVTLPRQQLLYVLQVNPGRLLNQLTLQGWVGEEVDFDNIRTGRGADIGLRATLRPSDHLELRLNESLRWLDVEAAGRGRDRLFTARVDRLRATYTFTARSFLRGIVQYVHTRRDPSLYVGEVARRDAELAGSLLFAYKLNWQTVLFVGYGDNRELSGEERLEPSDRQFFLKLSYAFQR